MFGRVNPPGLVYKIDLTKIADRANPRTVEAPIAGNTAGLPFTIDWGDGNSTDYSAGASAYPSHEYAAVGVYTVTIRSANGKLPKIAFSAYNSTRNIVPALISVDHHGGESYNASQAFYYTFADTVNCVYVDTRFPGQAGWTNFNHAFRNSGIQQPINFFCFDFATLASAFTATFIFCEKLTGALREDMFANNVSATSFSSVIQGCINITGSIPEGLFKNNTLVNNIASCFYACAGLTGDIPSTLFDTNILITNVSGAFRSCTGLTAPYEFWNKSYAANITNSANCYTGCSSMTLSEIPTAYGGTMTVS